MTHDPLCPWFGKTRTYYNSPVLRCQCKLIARVREDERDRNIDRWRKQVLAEADERRADGYAAALRGAVEALEVLPVAYDERQNDLPVVSRDAVLAAIEALGGVR